MARSSELKTLKNVEDVNSRKSVRWSAVPVGPKSMYVITMIHAMLKIKNGGLDQNIETGT